MLNKLLEKLNGQSADAVQLARALVELGEEESAARRGLADVQERRRQALLDDASDAVLDKLERELTRASARIDKCELSAPLLRERLAAARAAAHKQAVARHFEKITMLYEARVRSAVLEAEGAL